MSSQAVKRTRRRALAPLQENGGVAETPMAAGRAQGLRGVPFTPAAPATLMRMPQLGETFYSQKGAHFAVTSLSHMISRDDCHRDTLLSHSHAQSPERESKLVLD